MKKLLIEHTSQIILPRSTIQESIEKNGGKLIVRNVLLQRADTPNRNKRVYSKRILERELNEYFNKIREKRAYSELDHPVDAEGGNVISLKNVCQAIIDARWKGNEIYGDVEILKTPSGNIVKELLLAGFRVGQSSRGLGSVEPLREGSDDDIVEVQDDFELITLADCVSDPSTHNADMIMGENLISENNSGNRFKNSDNSYVNQLNNRYQNIENLMREIRCELGGVCCLK